MFRNRKLIVIINRRNTNERLFPRVARRRAYIACVYTYVGVYGCLCADTHTHTRTHTRVRVGSG